jgi:predicted nicotinamide N-methyase
VTEERHEGCWKGLRVLELGSGTGWLALRLASRGAAVTATDRPGAVPLLAQNVVRNQEFLRSMERRGDHDGAVDHTGESWNVQVRALEWESAMPDGWSESDRGPQRGGVEDDVGADGAMRTDEKWDVILATDILYLHESHRPLLATIRKHSRALCGSAAQAAEMPTLVVIGWEQRHPAEEADFRALAADMGLAGMPGTPREIGTNPVTGKTVWVAVWTVV